jgi:hypothetical protein
MASNKYLHIKRLPTFNVTYKSLRDYLKRINLTAYLELPNGLTIILDAIELSRHGWPIKRVKMGRKEEQFHLAVVDIGTRTLHVRYHVDSNDCAHLLVAWVDGNDTPPYQLP